VGVGEHLFQASTPSADYWDNVVTVPAGSQIIVRIPLLEQADLLADILQKKQEAEVDKAERAQLVEDKKSIEDGISALTGQHNDNMTSAQKDTAGGQTTIGIGQTLVNSGNDTAVLMGAFVYATGFIWQLKANGDVNAAKRNEDQIQYLRDQERQLADSEGPPSTSSPVKSAQDFHDLYVSVGPLSEF